MRPRRLLTVVLPLALFATAVYSQGSSGSEQSTAPPRTTTSSPPAETSSVVTSSASITSSTARSSSSSAVSSTVSSAASSSAVTRQTGSAIVTSDDPTDVTSGPTSSEGTIPAPTASNPSQSQGSSGGVAPETVRILVIVGSVVGAILLCAFGTLVWNKCVKRESVKPPFLPSTGSNGRSSSSGPEAGARSNAAANVPTLDMVPVPGEPNGQRRNVPLPQRPPSVEGVAAGNIPGGLVGSEGAWGQASYINETVPRTSFTGQPIAGNPSMMPSQQQSQQPYGYAQGYAPYPYGQYQGQPQQQPYGAEVETIPQRRIPFLTSTSQNQAYYANYQQPYNNGYYGGYWQQDPNATGPPPLDQTQAWAGHMTAQPLPPQGDPNLQYPQGHIMPPPEAYGQSIGYGQSGEGYVASGEPQGFMTPNAAQGAVLPNSNVDGKMAGNMPVGNPGMAEPAPPKQ
ncbi:hypothetical protein HDU67_007977 [Dinochytrium kinnereticum]|nr:hypothetical protein HDU67_007977 [Dinochytrium kinnereticum]